MILSTAACIVVLGGMSQSGTTGKKSSTKTATVTVHMKSTSIIAKSLNLKSVIVGAMHSQPASPKKPCKVTADGRHQIITWRRKVLCWICGARFNQK